jgi:transcription-repair coupling factor (superfamily II helicase)
LKISRPIPTCRSSAPPRGSWPPARSILIAPVESAALKLFDRDYYAGLAVTLKRGEEVDVEVLTAHLASVGYTQMDLVEMPGQFTRRGGILDVYSPEADRPVRIEFFGDEIETIRKFDPETQRSQSGLDEAQLLPLTETPVTERLLAAVHARLSRQRVEVQRMKRRDGRREAAAGGVSVFPGWEFFSAWPARRNRC